MIKYSTNNLKEALQPINSLISKSEKAQRKLTAGTWQHSMLQSNLKTLHIARALMNNEAINATVDDLQAAIKTLNALIVKVEKTESKFLPGTAQHSLQRNRLKSLQIALEFITKSLINIKDKNISSSR